MKQQITSQGREEEDTTGNTDHNPTSSINNNQKKRKRKQQISSQGRGEEDRIGNKDHNPTSSSNNDNKRRRKKKSLPLSIITNESVATSRQKNEGGSSNLLTTLLRPLLVKSLGYLDHESIRQVCLLSKEFLDIMRNCNGMEDTLFPLLLHISPFEKKNKIKIKGRLERLFQQLYRHRDELQPYLHVKIVEGHKFWCHDWDSIRYNFHLHGVVSLDISSSKPEDWFCVDSDRVLDFHHALAMILPNLQELNLSNTGIGCTALRRFSEKCHGLEKITWNNFDHNSNVSICGNCMSASTNLKEIYMDGAVFCDFV